MFLWETWNYPMPYAAIAGFRVSVYHLWVLSNHKVVRRFTARSREVSKPHDGVIEWSYTLKGPSAALLHVL